MSDLLAQKFFVSTFILRLYFDNVETLGIHVNLYEVCAEEGWKVLRPSSQAHKVLFIPATEGRMQQNGP